MMDSFSSTSGPGTLVEFNVEARAVLAFKIETERLLPVGWADAPFDAGPMKGANCNVVFADRLLVTDGTGQPLSGQDVNQLAVIAVRARRPDGVVALLIIFGLSARPGGAPGPYGVFEPADVHVDRRLGARGAIHRDAHEHWSFTNHKGVRLDLDLTYNRGVPNRPSAQTAVAHSGANPDFRRTYVTTDQGVDILRAEGRNLGLTALTFVADFPVDHPLRGLLPTEPAAVISLPWMSRQVFIEQPTSDFGGNVEHEKKIRQVMDDLVAAWNAGDAKAWVKDYAQDSDIINMLGVVLIGRDENERRHAAVFAGIFRSSTLLSSVRRIRFEQSRYVAIVDTNLVLSGYQGVPAGIEEHPDRTLRMTMRHVLVRQGDDWQIIASQNTAEMPPPSGTDARSSAP